MPRLEVRKYLYDIQQAAKRIQTFTRSCSLSDYEANAMLRSAVERQLEIVGEAIGRLLRQEPGLEAAISQARRVVGLRNRLIHGYADISNDIVWAIATIDVPRLLAEVTTLLDSPE